jgi:hypothetical protein
MRYVDSAERTYVGPSIQHCSEGKDGDDDLLLPQRPIQWVIGILARLRRQDDVRVASFTMLEALGDCFRVCCLIIQQYSPGDMVELGIYI